MQNNIEYSNVTETVCIDRSIDITLEVTRRVTQIPNESKAFLLFLYFDMIKSSKEAMYRVQANFFPG